MYSPIVINAIIKGTYVRGKAIEFEIRLQKPSERYENRWINMCGRIFWSNCPKLSLVADLENKCFETWYSVLFYADGYQHSTMFTVWFPPPPNGTPQFFSQSSCVIQLSLPQNRICEFLITFALYNE